MNFNNLEFHELADLFPLLQGEELREIVDDIKDNGFRREPITLLGGKILDGRNRYNAAKLAGYQLQRDDVEHFEQRYPGQDPLLFVVAKNLHRRHLTVGQRACLAAELYKRMPKRPVGQPKELSGIPDNTPTAKESLKKAAEMADVSVDSAQQILRIEKLAHDLAAHVKTGKISLHAASQEFKGRAPTRKDTLSRFGHVVPIWARHDLDEDQVDQILIDNHDEQLLSMADNFKNQVFALARTCQRVIDHVEVSRNPRLIRHVFDHYFRLRDLPRIQRFVDRLVDPGHYDLGTDLYSQLREVERCLDRFPDQLPEAVNGLIDLIRQYNPELALKEA
jgi:hypothetical protein